MQVHVFLFQKVDQQTYKLIKKVPSGSWGSTETENGVLWNLNDRKLRFCFGDFQDTLACM